MSVMRVIVLRMDTEFEVRRPSCSEDTADFHGTAFMLLASDFSIYKWGPHSCHGFPSIFSRLRPSI